MQIQEIRKHLDVLLSERKAAEIRVNDEQVALQKTTRIVTATLKAQQLVQQVAETVQASAHKQISSVVSKCLETVFGDDAYQFSVKFVQKRGKTEAILTLSRDGMEIEDPINEVGGGVVDIASFALRLSELMLTQPKCRRFIAIDEGFKFVSKEYRPAVKELLLMLAKEMELQILLITHIPELVVGNVVEL